MTVERQENRKATLFIPLPEEPSVPVILNQWLFRNGTAWFLAEVPIQSECADMDATCTGKAFVKYLQRSKEIRHVTCQAADINSAECRHCTGMFLVDLVKLQLETRTW